MYTRKKPVSWQEFVKGRTEELETTSKKMSEDLRLDWEDDEPWLDGDDLDSISVIVEVPYLLLLDIHHRRCEWYED